MDQLLTLPITKRGWVVSQFWNGVIQTKQSLKRGLAIKVNNWRNSLFWDDIWASDIPLRLEFLTLYDIYDDKHCLVVDCWAGDGWRVGFRRPLGQNEVGEWERLMEMLDLQTARHNGVTDSYKWLFKKSGIYSTRCT